jgi:hypothetical protein
MTRNPPEVDIANIRSKVGDVNMPLADLSHSSIEELADRTLIFVKDRRSRSYEKGRLPYRRRLGAEGTVRTHLLARPLCRRRQL